MVTDGDMKVNGDDGSTLEMFRALSPKLLKMTTIQVDLDLRELYPSSPAEDPIPYSYAVNRFLFALGHFVNSNTKPRRLTLSAKDGQIVKKLVDDSFWPLHIFQPHIEVEYRGVREGPTKAHPATEPSAGDLITQLIQHRRSSSSPASISSISEFLRLGEREGFISRAYTNLTHELGRQCLAHASEMLLVNACCIKENDAMLNVDLIAAVSLLDTAGDQGFDRLLEPPVWLLRTFIITKGAFGTRVAKFILGKKFSPLRNLVERITWRS